MDHFCLLGMAPGNGRSSSESSHGSGPAISLPRMVKKLKLPEIQGIARFPRLLAAGRLLRCLRYSIAIERWREWPGKPRTNILTIRDIPHGRGASACTCRDPS